MILGILIILTGLTLAHLRRHLPLQNVAMAAVVLLLLALAFEALTAASGFRLHLHPRFFGMNQFVAAPLIWLFLLLNARALLRFAVKMCGWKNCGFWVLAGSAVFTAMGWQLLQTERTFAATAIDFVLRLVGAAGLFVCIFPWLIDKKPQTGSGAAGSPPLS